MHKRISVVLLSMVLVACGTLDTPGPAPSQARKSSLIISIEDLAQVAPAMGSGTERTLVVFDIDDTLLTSETFYGSDYWYEWQKELPDGHSAKVPCRFDVIAMNYEAGTQRRTQDDSSNIFNSISGDKLLLTSRNAVSRGGTMRELLKAGYVMPPQIDGSNEGVLYLWKNDAADTPKVVSYSEGVFMASGKDKGKALVNLLARVRKDYDRIVLVDDGVRNIESMRAALAQTKISYLGLHYTRIKKPLPLPAERAGSEAEATRAWAQLESYLGNVFPERLQELEAGKCYL